MACRYTYGETIYKWRTADLLIGLAYLCSKEPEEHPLVDVGFQGHVFGEGYEGYERENAVKFLDRVERAFKYCSGLRERRPIFQKRYMVEVMDIPEGDVLKQEVRAGVLKPSFVLTKDDVLHSIVLSIRGTHSFKDAFTSLTGASKPHHVVDSNGVILGYSHFGMLAAARWMKSEVGEDFKRTLEDNPGYQPLIIGHSLGGGTAAMLTMMLREQGGPLLSDTQCIAIACPACMTLELAESCKDYVTTVVNNCDVIPTISPGSADRLRESMLHSSWYADFRHDMRSSKIFRAVESGIKGVGSATTWTAGRLSACYQRSRSAVQHKRRKSDDGMIPVQLDNVPYEDEISEDIRGSMQASSSAPVTPLNTHAKGSWNINIREFVSSTAQYMGAWRMPEKQDGGEDSQDGDKADRDYISAGVESLNIDDGPGSLRAEASFRMRAVQNAMLDAEAENQDEGNGRQKRNFENAVPSVIRPGNYGESSGSQKLVEQSWKRSMYPAGRILHLVPATVVPGYKTSGVDDGYFEQNLDTSNVVYSSTHSRHVSELSFDDYVGAEEAAGSAAVVEGAASIPLPPLKPAPGPAPKNMILLDGVPQKAYGRIRLCKSVLQDHVIPNYLRSLESFRKTFGWQRE